VFGGQEGGSEEAVAMAFFAISGLGVFSSLAKMNAIMWYPSSRKSGTIMYSLITPSPSSFCESGHCGLRGSDRFRQLADTSAGVLQEFGYELKFLLSHCGSPVWIESKEIIWHSRFPFTVELPEQKNGKDVFYGRALFAKGTTAIETSMKDNST
jgi:hypothetical protein